MVNLALKVSAKRWILKPETTFKFDDGMMRSFELFLFVGDQDNADQHPPIKGIGSGVIPSQSSVLTPPPPILII